ncbi:hypothetical protein KAR91_38090 [Candidatus Pacearchaeota archaeon]|nr:hypothetical protein [Candidatus Pacearchaeota archaeon]
MFEGTKQFFRNVGNRVTGKLTNLEKLPLISKLAKTPSELFPCASCIITYNVCKKPCDELTYSRKELTELFIKYEKCPDCGYDKLAEDPYGGMSQNISCRQCGHKFNVLYPMGFERIGTFSQQK